MKFHEIQQFHWFFHCFSKKICRWRSDLSYAIILEDDWLFPRCTPWKLTIVLYGAEDPNQYKRLLKTLHLYSGGSIKRPYRPRYTKTNIFWILLVLPAYTSRHMKPETTFSSVWSFYMALKIPMDSLVFYILLYRKISPHPSLSRSKKVSWTKSSIDSKRGAGRFFQKVGTQILKRVWFLFFCAMQKTMEIPL